MQHSYLIKRYYHIIKGLKWYNDNGWQIIASNRTLTPENPGCWHYVIWQSHSSVVFAFICCLDFIVILTILNTTLPCSCDYLFCLLQTSSLWLWISLGIRHTTKIQGGLFPFLNFPYLSLKPHTVYVGSNSLVC